MRHFLVAHGVKSHGVAAVFVRHRDDFHGRRINAADVAFLDLKAFAEGAFTDKTFDVPRAEKRFKCLIVSIVGIHSVILVCMFLIYRTSTTKAVTLSLEPFARA